MVTSSLSFSAAVDAWTRETNDRMTRVFRASTQEVASIAQNGVPVDTGFARASVRGSKESMPQIVPDFKGEKGKPYDASGAFGEVTLMIAGLEIGETAYIGWTANYVIPLEFGHSQQAPAGFVRLAAAQWQVIVNGVTAELKGRSSAQ
jgi:hypothetical protein